MRSLIGNGNAIWMRQLQHRIDRRAHRVRVHAPVALRAVCVADARPEQPEIVVDLRGGPDRRAARLGRVLLLDRDRGRDPLDRVDERLLHALEELLGVGGERLDVAALTLGVERVERERALPRPGRAGEHGQATPRNVEVDALQVVLAGSADADGVIHGRMIRPP
jgi:hypothetical protein